VIKNIFGKVLFLFMSFAYIIHNNPIYANNRAKIIPDLALILARVDQQYRFKTGHAELEMQIKTKNWQRTMRLEMWTKGLKKTLITIKTPKKDAGITTLRLAKSMWNYFPKINKVIKVPPSMMMGSWMGSDFTNDDLVKESTYLEDYSAKFSSGPAPDKYYIELRPKKNTVSVWDKVNLVVDKKTLILRQQENFDERGEKVRTMLFSDIKIMGGQLIPTTMSISSHKHQGNQTIVRYLSATFNKEMLDSVFSRRNLQKKR